jgi:hypothetical protein
LPLLLVLSGRAWWRQTSELEALSTKAEAAQAAGKTWKSTQHGLDKLLAHLPKLAPLQCHACGAGLRLGLEDATCAHCSTRRPLPEDYAVLAKLRQLCAPLIARANGHVRLANLLQHPLTRLWLRSMILVEPALFTVVLIGATMQEKTRVDRALEAMGEGPAFVLMLMAFLGFIIWMVVFILWANLASEVRKDLPALPALRPVVRAREPAQCTPCGGPIQYEGGALAALCDYCHVLSYRARFAGQERATSQAKVQEADSLLFSAMQIIEEHTGTFFFTLSIMCLGSVLLALLCLFRADS